jgi:phosphatidylglycerophosphate synthase
VDALLILVLSVDVARVSGWWVLTMGAARYAVLAASVVAPWLRAGVAPRYWRKAVAATQGVVLTVAAGGVLAPRWASVALLVAAGLLGLSFLTEVVELWRRRGRELRSSRDLRPEAHRLPDRGLAVGAS